MTDQKKRRLVILVAILTAVAGLLLLLFIVGVLMTLMAVQQAREAARREQARNNLAQVRLALENYNKQHPALPSSEQPETALPAALAIIQTKEFVDPTHAFEPGIPHWPGFPDEERATIYWFEDGGGTMGTGFFA